MPDPIQRTRLGQRVAAALHTELQRGTWQDQLPGERVLSGHFGVSRPVLREGLALLRAQGLLAVTAREGYRITGSMESAPAPKPDEIHVLSPSPAAKLRLFTNLWLDELRRLLHEAGHRLVVHDGARYHSLRPAHALRQLVHDHPAAAWVLIHSNRKVQQWFVEQKLPVIVAGSVHPGLPLPSVRIDVEAVSRHAAGVLIRMGHRRVAFLNLRTDRAGDHESEQAFLQIARGASVQAQIVHHEPTAESMDRAVRRLMARQPRITGMLVGHSETYIGVLSSLARLGLRIPEDISLVSREDDPFLSATLPAPARYRANPLNYARRINRALMAIRAGQTKLHPVSSVVPELFKGGSVRSPV